MNSITGFAVFCIALLIQVGACSLGFYTLYRLFAVVNHVRRPVQSFGQFISDEHKWIIVLVVLIDIFLWSQGA